MGKNRGMDERGREGITFLKLNERSPDFCEQHIHSLTLLQCDYHIRGGLLIQERLC